MADSSKKVAQKWRAKQDALFRTFATNPKRLPTVGPIALRFSSSEKRTDVAYKLVCFPPITYLPPDASFGALLSLQNTPRDSMPSESTTSTSPENPPVVDRPHSVVFKPETPRFFHRFFSGFFLSSKAPSRNQGSYTHCARQISVKKQHS